MSLPRWYRKMIAKGEIAPPAIVIMGKGGPRGLVKDEVKQGLEASKERQEPTRIQWEMPEKKEDEDNS